MAAMFDNFYKSSSESQLVVLACREYRLPTRCAQKHLKAAVSSAAKSV